MENDDQNEIFNEREFQYMSYYQPSSPSGGLDEPTTVRIADT